jgi:purine-cytosine permease-like protein
MLGAAFAAAAPGIPDWQTGSENGNNVGGLIGAILQPSGGFGKFLIVLLALSVPSAGAPTMYTFGECYNNHGLAGLTAALVGMSFMAISPIFAKIPRYVYAIVAEAM